MDLKNVLTSLLSFFAPVFLNAQDHIVMRNAQEVDAKVITVSQDIISYKKWSNIEGPTYEVDRQDVLFIRYQNGEKEIFTTDNDVSALKGNRKDVRFQAYAFLGVDFCGYAAGPTADITGGVRCTDFFYAGVETGFHTMIEDGFVGGYIPVGLNLKGYIPLGDKIMPYINCTLGAAFGVIDFYGSAFYCNAGVGVDLNRFSFGAGYMNLGGYEGHFGYVKIGYRFDL